MLYAKSLSNIGRNNDAISILENLIAIHPLNKNLPLIISDMYTSKKQNPSQVIKLLNSVSQHHILSPNFFRTLSKSYSQKNDAFNSSLNLADYYVITGNYRLAIEVLLNTLKSNKINSTQRGKLIDKKNRIICTYNRPLEPIFGEKTCN